MGRIASQRETGSEATPSSGDDRPVTTLRGAGVDVDPRRAARVAVVVSFVVLVVLAAVLFAAGASKNSQIDDLRSHGVPVTVTVTSCLGLLGGSGSNQAGYACRGSYRFASHRYEEAIPGDSFRPVGSKVAAVVSPTDPGLVATARQVAAERASLNVYVAPGVLLLATVALGTVVLAKRRSRA